MGLADELLEDAHSLANRGITDQRQTLMRRSISTAYYAAFHLFIEDFVEHWEFPDQRARLGRMFGHSKMCTGFTPKDKKQDYDSGWRLVETDVRNAIRLAEDVFANWRRIKSENVARHHLLSMFGARSD